MFIKHYNDGKGKWQSHEMSFADEEGYFKKLDDNYIYSHDIGNIIVYGSSKEECYEKLKQVLDFMIVELNDLKSSLNDNTVVIKDVDCLWEEID